MKRVIFVDDEPKILDGLKRMLRVQRREWEMVFVTSGQSALDEMEKSPFDVIVSDMRMPGMDGATLLTKVQDEFPSTVRIVLSGYTELEASMRAVPVAHQFLTKPCSSKLIREVVGRACALQELLTDKILREVLGKIESLPAIPQVYNALTLALANQEVTVEEVAGIVEQDAGICVKVLQLVNSSFFALPQNISDIKHAITYLGTNMFRNLVLSMEVFEEFNTTKHSGALDIQAEQVHATTTARIAQEICPDRSLAEHAFMAGMLHDMGRLILATQLKETYERIVALDPDGTKPTQVIEEEVLGVSHAEVGGYLLGIWGMPYPIVEAVANHHEPRRVEHESFDVLGSVHVADYLSRMACEEMGHKLPHAPAPLDNDYLEAMGVAERLPDWQELGMKVMAEYRR